MEEEIQKLINEKNEIEKKIKILKKEKKEKEKNKINNEINDTTKINNFFEYTRNTKDKIKIKDFNEILWNNNILLKKYSIKIHLLSCGVKQSNHPILGKCYIGIKLKQ